MQIKLNRTKIKLNGIKIKMKPRRAYRRKKKSEMQACGIPKNNNLKTII
jgi:hypothetical protein